LDNIPVVCLIIDLWDFFKTEIIGICAHFIDANWDWKHYIIYVKGLENEKHITSSVIAKHCEACKEIYKFQKTETN
jgi:hypothetical protein